VDLDEEEGYSQGSDNLRRPIHNGVFSPNVTYKIVMIDNGTTVKSMTGFVKSLILIIS